MEQLNVCLDCGYEWEENGAERCRRCNGGDFYIALEIDEK